MTQRERLESMKSWLQIHHEISIEIIMEKWNVSRDTARRDLVKLEKMGDVVRTKGGAVLASHQVIRYGDRSQNPSKIKIAKRACELIQEHDHVMFDTSTTVELVAKQLIDQPLSVVTNSIDIVAALSDHSDIDIYMIGGKFNRYHRSFLGFQAAEELSKYRVDKLFIGACGLGLEGLTASSDDEAYVKRSMIASAREVTVLMDHSKLHKSFLHHVCELSAVHRIITDQPLTDEIKAAAEEYEMDVIITNN
ncbi:DeoR/GlpR family DNA-binding transcription regulator [Priestia koreensis]|uniref:DeoR/GlpR family DNA-binding transcription regulator n=1 Tax=Priestia koreensis TaxID=284581 RepID=UPI0028F74854|nr:DeoR/GlpR family DNA-binding transcription regulator [Priestia koreensis]